MKLDRELAGAVQSSELGVIAVTNRTDLLLTTADRAPEARQPPSLALLPTSREVVEDAAPNGDILHESRETVNQTPFG